MERERDRRGNRRRIVLCGVVTAGLLRLAACGQKDPEGVGGTGAIGVTSDEPGATIVLDGGETPSVTPDTLVSIPVGAHEISVRKEGFSVDPASRTVSVREGEVALAAFALTSVETGLDRIVLLEDFSNTGCIPCVESDSVVNEVLSSFGITQVVGIQFHVYWPFPGDPFYLAAVDENNSRSTYYGVDLVGVPFVMLDGVAHPSATSGALIEQAVGDRLSVDAAVSIEARNDVVGSSGTANVTVVGLAGAGGFGALRLRCVVVEGEIHHNAQNGLTLFDNVMRRMLPSADGEPISPAAGDTLSFSWPYTIDSNWLSDKLSVVAFVQDEGSKEVLQAATSRR